MCEISLYRRMLVRHCDFSLASSLTRALSLALALSLLLSLSLSPSYLFPSFSLIPLSLAAPSSGGMCLKSCLRGSGSRRQLARKDSPFSNRLGHATYHRFSSYHVTATKLVCAAKWYGDTPYEGNMYTHTCICGCMYVYLEVCISVHAYMHIYKYT
jgi:hypothetical protein